MKIEWVDGMETLSWKIFKCLHLVKYFEKEGDTVNNKSNTLRENIFFLLLKSTWNLS